MRSQPCCIQHWLRYESTVKIKAGRCYEKHVIYFLASELTNSSIPMLDR